MAETARKSKATPNVYTALLLIAMLALLTAVVFVWKADVQLTGDQHVQGALRNPLYMMPRDE